MSTAKTLVRPPKLPEPDEPVAQRAATEVLGERHVEERRQCQRMAAGGQVHDQRRVVALPGRYAPRRTGAVVVGSDEGGRNHAIEHRDVRVEAAGRNDHTRLIGAAGRVGRAAVAPALDPHLARRKEAELEAEGVLRIVGIELAGRLIATAAITTYSFSVFVDCLGQKLVLEFRSKLFEHVAHNFHSLSTTGEAVGDLTYRIQYDAPASQVARNGWRAAVSDCAF